jgi:hypothetical protein
VGDKILNYQKRVEKLGLFAAIKKIIFFSHQVGDFLIKMFEVRRKKKIQVFSHWNLVNLKSSEKN